MRDRATLALDGPLPLLEREESPGSPPLDGPLVPVREGWLLRRVEGAEPWNLVPRRFRGAALALGIGPLLLVDLASGFVGGPTGLSFLALLVVLRWSRPMADALIRKTMRRAAAVTSLAGRGRGEPVLLRGRVRPGPSFQSAGGQFSAVLVCYTGTVEHTRRGRARSRKVVRSWAEVRGIDFLLDLDSGETVVVAVRDAYLLAPRGTLLDMLSYRTADAVPAPLGRVVRRVASGVVTESVVAELVIAPDDEIEVYGELDWEVTPAAASGRSVGLAPVVRGGARAPLVVHPRGDGRS